MPDDFMASLQREAADVSSAPGRDDSLRLTKLAQELVRVTSEADRLEAELKRVNVRKGEIQFKELPDLMSEIGQDRIGLPDVGEHGADIVSVPYYKANIAADWDEERREAAFAHLDDLGAGDLVKNVLTLSFSREQHELVQKVVDLLKESPLGNQLPEPQVARSVSWNTLTAWLRERYEEPKEGDEPVDLELIDGTVGTVAKIKYRKG